MGKLTLLVQMLGAEKLSMALWSNGEKPEKPSKIMVKWLETSKKPSETMVKWLETSKNHGQMVRDQ